MNGRTKVVRRDTGDKRSSEAGGHVSTVPSITPISDDELIPVQDKTRLVITGNNDFHRTYYENLIIGSKELRGSISRDGLAKVVPSGIGLLAVTFTPRRILISPHKDMHIDGLFIVSQSTVGIEPGKVHVLDIEDLHITLEMKVD